MGADTGACRDGGTRQEGSSSSGRLSTLMAPPAPVVFNVSPLRRLVLCLLSVERGTVHHIPSELVFNRERQLADERNNYPSYCGTPRRRLRLLRLPDDSCVRDSKVGVGSYSCRS